MSSRCKDSSSMRDHLNGVIWQESQETNMNIFQPLRTLSNLSHSLMLLHNQQSKALLNFKFQMTCLLKWNRYRVQSLALWQLLEASSLFSMLFHISSFQGMSLGWCRLKLLEPFSWLIHPKEKGQDLLRGWLRKPAMKYTKKPKHLLWTVWRLPLIYVATFFSL